MAMTPIQNVNSVALVGTTTSPAKNIFKKFSIIIIIGFYEAQNSKKYLYTMLLS
jgi:hypothetical protein